MWVELPDLSNEERSFYRRNRRARLYADEDIEDEVVKWFRDHGVNITSARELDGHRGKPDEFHSAYAFRKKRFLLTKNTKDFYSDQRLPPHKLHGLICIEGDMSNVDRYATAALHLLHQIVPYGETFEGAKVIISADAASIRGRTVDGTIETKRFKFERGKTYSWEEPEQ